MTALLLTVLIAFVAVDAALYQSCSVSSDCTGPNEECITIGPGVRVCACKAGWRATAGFHSLVPPPQNCVVYACDSALASTKCLYGGKCQWAVSGSFCDCVNGWWGITCKDWNQGSAQLTHVLSGTVNYTETDTVTCKNGWSGPTCATAAACGGTAPSFCSGHGACENSDPAVGNPGCVCNPGYISPYCV